jgi:site-specific recombinase XerD
MKTSQSFGIHFTIRGYQAKEGKAPLYAVVTVNKERVLIGLKQKIDVKNWDSGKEAPKGNREDAKQMNAYLGEVRLALGNCYKELQLKGRLPSASAVKSLYLGEAEEKFTLSRLITYHNDTALSTIRQSTLTHYYVTQRYLIKFIEANYNCSDIYLNELNYKFVKDFEVFLRNHKPKENQKPIMNNGVVKHIVRLRKMVNLAVNLHWIYGDPFSTYKLKVQKVNREHLSERELELIEVKDFNIERLNMVRDLFVFACYTGLSYIDLINLTAANIVANEDGERWIRTCREKTSIPVSVPLLPQALAILDNYKFNERALAGGKVFPVISNQKVNSYLKEIAFRSSIDKNITFHLARHTFATTVTLSNGVPIETVSKILGHTKIATTQIYAKVVEKKLKEDMKALQQRLACAEMVWSHSS